MSEYERARPSMSSLPALLSVAMLTLCWSATASANVAPGMYDPGAGGQLTPLAETDLELSKERLQFALRPKDGPIVRAEADIDVEFVIHNPGDAQTVELAFVSSEGQDQTNSPIVDLDDMETTVNGTSVDVEEVGLEQDSGEWLKDQLLQSSIYDVDSEDRFAERRRMYRLEADLDSGDNTVTFSYQTAAGHSKLLTGHVDISYVLSTIHAWKGADVDDFELSIRAEDSGRLLFVPRRLDTDGGGTWSADDGLESCGTRDDSDYYYVAEDGAELTYRATTFTPERDLWMTYAPIPYDDLPFPLDDNDFNAEPGELYRM